jgi:site-specific recombinase XerD
MKLDKDILSHDEVKELLTQCNASCLTGLRNSILIVLLYESGLRVQEALDLRPKDLMKDSVRVNHGKGDEARTARLPESLLPKIELWLNRRYQERGITRKTCVFCTLMGNPLNQVYVREALHRLASKAGLEKRVHPHGLRRSFASRLLREGTPIGHIQDLLGHRHLQTTMIYLQKLDPRDAIVATKDLPSVYDDEPETEHPVLTRIAQLERELAELKGHCNGYMDLPPVRA